MPMSAPWRILVEQLRGVDQRLRGDAADVQADAAGLVLLHHQRLLLELPEPDPRDVAAGPGADHQRFNTNRLVRHGGTLIPEPRAPATCPGLSGDELDSSSASCSSSAADGRASTCSMSALDGGGPIACSAATAARDLRLDLDAHGAGRRRVQHLLAGQPAAHRAMGSALPSTLGDHRLDERCPFAAASPLRRGAHAGRDRQKISAIYAHAGDAIGERPHRDRFGHHQRLRLAVVEAEEDHRQPEDRREVDPGVEVLGVDLDGLEGGKRDGRLLLHLGGPGHTGGLRELRSGMFGGGQDVERPRHRWAAGEPPAAR